jgi:hypothetical protein
MERLADIGAENIRHLYVFFMKFNVFTYAVNLLESLRKSRSMSKEERPETLGHFRFFRLGPRLASILLTRGPGVLPKPTKEKVPAALAALQWSPA